MKYEEMIKEIYFVAGVLEGLSCTKGQQMTEASAFMLGDCVDRLELIGAQLINNSAPKLEIMGINDEDMALLMKPSKAVIVNERRCEEIFGRVYPAPEDASDQ